MLDNHGDAVTVLLIMLILGVTAVALLDRAYTRSARAQRTAYRALRDADRRAYWRLHRRYTALCQAGVTVEMAAAQAEALTAPSPYLPIFTEGEAR